MKEQDREAKIQKVMDEFKARKLRDSNGELVTDRKKALAIAMSEAGAMPKRKKPKDENDTEHDSENDMVSDDSDDAEEDEEDRTTTITITHAPKKKVHAV